MKEAIIPDYLYLNKEKLQSGELAVAIGETINTDNGEPITHEFIDIDVAQEKIDEAFRKGSETGYQEGYIDSALEAERERDVG